MARPTMTTLIARLRSLLANDATFTDDDLQGMLDDNALLVVEQLTPEQPRYMRHFSSASNFEAGAQVFFGMIQLATNEYAFDAQRGIVSTPQPDYRGLRLEGTAYDLNAAAADGWDRIAARFVQEFDFSTSSKGFKRSQQHTNALAQAKTFRQKAWAKTVTTERSDMLPGNGTADALIDGFRRSGR